jgi:hypothetical protein
MRAAAFELSPRSTSIGIIILPAAVPTTATSHEMSQRRTMLEESLVD